ncbi:MAG: SGNH/GDSL hydrolase family protein [Leptospiraceae bacterium]|nr:SGNH/GDSL hydrolase family protein [Leptospiraceae bacterium]
MSSWMAVHCSSEDNGLLEIVLPPDKVYLILGDSLTERSDGFYLEKLSPVGLTVFVRGVDGYDYVNWTQRMDEAFAGVDSPDQIITVLGSNDAARYGPDQFIENVQQFHAALRQRSGAPIIYSLVPRTRFSPVQAPILANNERLRTSAPEGQRIMDLDAAFESAIQQGRILYPDDEPIHPNRTGYELIGTTILQTLLQP